MKAKVTYTISVNTEEIDLVDFGHDEDTRFEDLTEQEQHDICDTLAVENYVQVYVKTIEP